MKWTNLYWSLRNLSLEPSLRVYGVPDGVARNCHSLPPSLVKQMVSDATRDVMSAYVYLTPVSGLTLGEQMTSSARLRLDVVGVIMATKVSSNCIDLFIWSSLWLLMNELFVVFNLFERVTAGAKTPDGSVGWGHR